nr:MAG TPA_asm: Protein of unknown function (DUF2786) [Caudoviricetes sp.]
MTDKEKILEKLKKLLALSKSDNPHEAALALQRVQKLMQAYTERGKTSGYTSLSAGRNSGSWGVAYDA